MTKNYCDSNEEMNNEIIFLGIRDSLGVMSKTIGIFICRVIFTNRELEEGRRGSNLYHRFLSLFFVFSQLFYVTEELKELSRNQFETS